MNIEKETRVTLSNGVTVVNFSSRRRLVFKDGTILKGVSEERARRLLCKPKEEVSDGPKDSITSVITYTVTDHLISELKRLIDDPSVDIIFVPVPVILALSSLDEHYDKVCRIFYDEDKVLPIEKFYKYKGD